jgi:hypothetical protein
MSSLVFGLMGMCRIRPVKVNVYLITRRLSRRIASHKATAV